MNANFGERLSKAINSLPAGYRKSVRPASAVILGSGLSGIAGGSGNALPYSSIEGFPRPTVEGHEGVMYLSERNVICAGRFHYYEGHAMEDVVFPIFLLRELGVETLILTNAAGAVNEAYAPGDLVLIRDHLNLMGTHPLIGPNPTRPDGVPFGPRFFDMSDAYDPRLRVLARETGAALSEGVYAALTGPSYETPAEIRMLKSLGADLVGMSTVPETIVARYLGMQVLGISCVTNMAAGIGTKPLDHAEVTETGKSVASRLANLISGVLERL
jgi:purine-nucleoside phosphorylase